MALPVQIVDPGTFNQRNANIGPFLVGGNVYVLAADAADLSIVNMFKATDPTTSFSEQDAANAPNTTGNAIEDIDAIVDGTDIHVAMHDGTRIWHAHFSTTSDTWQDVDPTAGTQTIYQVAVDSNNAAVENVSISVRSDGDIIITYIVSPTRDMGQNVDAIYYARKESGTWTADIAVADTSTKDNRRSGGYIVMGGSDQAHIAYLAEEDGDFHTRALSSGNTLRTERTSAQTWVWNDRIARGHRFTRSSTARIGWQVNESFVISGADPLRFVYYDDFSDDSSPTYTVETAESNGRGVAGISNFQSGLAFDDNETNDEQFLGFIDDTTIDIHLRSNAGSATWSDENGGSAIRGSITATALCGNVYLRDGNYVYAFVYGTDDAGSAPWPLNYDEFVLYSASPHVNKPQTMALI